ncbi:hypothetical protein HID58_059660 [Brassica napus]|uniref:C3H1-type domain-containing protein n=1 Tax=Brassica napus TaxID=3708 RepID=A0ABQ7ZTK0_BRANA|nr:hypothetical protein HID58_059660 [Brassica napus]
MGFPPPPLEVLLGPKTTYIKFLEKSKRKQDADGWGRSDFPIICESCLGVNPYVRMTQVDYDKECKLCTRPFSVFRWRPGRDAKQKFVTHVASGRMCVKSLDLEYGLPVQVRDTALNIGNHNSIPKSDVNRELFAEEHDQRTRAGLDYESSFGKIRPNDTIGIIQRTTPHYKRNRAHICSFYIRGECTKGDECPYRHEMHATGEHCKRSSSVEVTWKGWEISSTPMEISNPSESWLRKHVPLSHTQTREGAEKAAEELSNKLLVNSEKLNPPQTPSSASAPTPDSMSGVLLSAIY